MWGNSCDSLSTSCCFVPISKTSEKEIRHSQDTAPTRVFLTNRWPTNYLTFPQVKRIKGRQSKNGLTTLLNGLEDHSKGLRYYNASKMCEWIRSGTQLLNDPATTAGYRIDKDCYDDDDDFLWAFFFSLVHTCRSACFLNQKIVLMNYLSKKTNSCLKNMFLI